MSINRFARGTKLSRMKTVCLRFKRRLFFVACFIALSCACFAQDMIVTKDSKKVDAKVTEINVDDVKYKRFDHLDGPTYTIPKSEIVTIIYQNGLVETFETEKPAQPTPTTAVVAKTADNAHMAAQNGIVEGSYTSENGKNTITFSGNQFRISMPMNAIFEGTFSLDEEKITLHVEKRGKEQRASSGTEILFYQYSDGILTITGVGGGMNRKIPLNIRSKYLYSGDDTVGSLIPIQKSSQNPIAAANNQEAINNNQEAIANVSAQSELTYKGGVMQNGTKLTPTKVKEVMSGNSEALKTYNSGQAIGTVGVILSCIGGGLIGWDLGMRLSADEGNGTLLAIGAVGIGAGLCFALIGDANVKKSVTLYNAKTSNNAVSYQVNFGFTQTGIGFNVRF